MRKSILFFSILLTTTLAAQDEPMQVNRCDAVNRKAPIYNVHVDEENVKWVANRDGLFKVYDLSYSEKVEISSLDQSLLSIPGGNADIRWSTEELNGILNGALTSTNTLTSAAYNAEKDELWLGTTETGVFKLKTQPNLRLVEEINDRTSKLKSNYVNKIYLDTLGREWIATREGVMVSDNRGKWDLLEKYFDILSVAVGPSGDWLLTSEYFGNLDKKDVWYPIELPPRSTEGRLTDIVFDKEGRLWVSSDVITSYNPETEKVNVYGPAQYYTSEFATSMAADKDGGIWVATEDKGLFLIEKASNLTVSAIIEQELSCAEGADDAVIKARVVGGIPPHKYSWSNGSTAETLNDLGPGLYELTVTDSRGRKKMAQVKISDPRIKANITLDKTESEDGAEDGAATVTVTGGTSQYSYRWDNGETTAQAVALSEGLHKVTVTDKNGCSTVAEINVDRAVLPLTAKVEPTSELDCPGSSTAALAATIEGGREPFTYQWSTGGTERQIDNLPAGDYALTVSDAAGNTVTTNYTISPGKGLQLEVQTVAPATTGNTDGQASVQVSSGGSGDYAYQWDNGETTAKATRLSPGDHTVTVTDQKGCSATATININENILPLQASIQPTASILCFGQASGGLKVTPAGGKGPFQYQWSDGSQTTAERNELPAGEYTVTITDAEGTTTTASYTLKQPDKITAQVNVIQPASTGREDGQAEVIAEGGSGRLSYSWDNGEIQKQAKRLAPGKHSVTITDRNNCETTAEVEIAENILPLTATIQQTQDIKCQGETTAALRVIANGGKGPFQIRWNYNEETGNAISNLPAGNYEVNITDAEGNTTTASYVVEEPSALTANAMALEPASTNNADGKAKVTAKGGAGAYTYRWDNDEIGQEAVELSPGTHTVEVQDDNGCSTTAEVNISENILPLTASIEQTGDIDCYGETTAGLQANVSGGKGPFTYRWNVEGAQEAQLSQVGAGTYSLAITDAEGTTVQAEYTIEQPNPLSANAAADEPASTGNSDGKASVRAQGGTGNYSYSWDNGETTQQATSLAPGIHTVTITDQNGCTTTAEVEITENILPLTANIEQTAGIDCFGEAAAALKVNRNGGKGPFRFQWSDPALQGEEVSGLAAGQYQVSITDAVGSTTTASITVEQPLALSATFSNLQPASTDNEDGQASVQVKGGAGNYTFAWDNGATTQQVNNLAPGNHTVTITDQNGCTTTAEVEITENILPLTASIEQTAGIDCFGEAAAALKVNRNGGKGPFRFQWSDPALQGEEVNNLAAGQYQVSVTDAVGSTTTASITVEQPLALAASINNVQAASTDNEDGRASVQVNGGKPGYTFAWDNGETTQQATRLAPGNHTVTITDQNGCTTTAEVEITENILPLRATVEVASPIRCDGAQNGEISVSLKGGKQPFQFQWNNEAASGQQPKGLSEGTYAVTITDAIGQTAKGEASLIAPSPMEITTTFLSAARDEEANDGKATVEVKGGTPDYSFAWDNGEKTKTASSLSYGKHIVSITDNFGCVDTASVFVEKRKIPELAVEDVEEGQKIRIEALQFQADSTKIQEKYFPVLDELYAFLSDNQSIAIEIGGHTNGLPPDWYCDELSTARAKSIADYLINLGIAKWRVLHKGYGKRFPIASNETEEGRRQNQRIEITILSLGNK